MSNKYSEKLLELAKNEHVPETAKIWAEWSIQTALDKEIQKYGPPTERDNLDEDERYNARKPTHVEESAFNQIQEILHESSSLEETVERITERARHYQQALENGYETEELNNTREDAYDTIPEIYFGILKKANTQFEKTLGWVENYEKQNEHQ